MQGLATTTHASFHPPAPKDLTRTLAALNQDHSSHLPDAGSAAHARGQSAARVLANTPSGIRHTSLRALGLLMNFKSPRSCGRLALPHKRPASVPSAFVSTPETTPFGFTVNINLPKRNAGSPVTAKRPSRVQGPRCSMSQYTQRPWGSKTLGLPSRGARRMVSVSYPEPNGADSPYSAAPQRTLVITACTTQRDGSVDRAPPFGLPCSDMPTRRGHSSLSRAQAQSGRETSRALLAIRKSMPNAWEERQPTSIPRRPPVAVLGRPATKPEAFSGAEQRGASYRAGTLSTAGSFSRDGVAACKAPRHTHLPAAALGTIRVQVEASGKPARSSPGIRQGLGWPRFPVP